MASAGELPTSSYSFPRRHAPICFVPLWMDMRMPGSPSLYYNTLHDAISLSYQYKDFTAKAMGDVRWRHSEGKMRDFTTLDAFDYHYGLMAR